MANKIETTSGSRGFEIAPEVISEIDTLVRGYEHDLDLTKKAVRTAETDDIRRFLTVARDKTESRFNLYSSLKTGLSDGSLFIQPSNTSTYNPESVPECDVHVGDQRFALGPFEILDIINLVTTADANEARIAMLHKLQNGEIVSFQKPMSQEPKGEISSAI